MAPYVICIRHPITMLTYIHIIVKTLFIFLLVLQHSVFAQYLTKQQITELQAIDSVSGHFNVFVLYDIIDKKAQVRVVVGVDYGLVNNSDIKSLISLMSTFAKVFIPAHDSATLVGKELIKNHAHCSSLRDSPRLACSHINWGLPTLMCGCAAILGSVITYTSPTASRVIATLVASYFMRDFYSMWKYETGKVRAKLMATALIEEVSDTKVLAVTDKVSAILVKNKLMKSGKYELLNILDEQHEADEPTNVTPKNNLKFVKSKEEHQKQEVANGEPEKSETELAKEAAERMEIWEKERQARIAFEVQKAREEKIYLEWKKREKHRN